jgi:hypothetical protein
MRYILIINLTMVEEGMANMFLDGDIEDNTFNFQGSKL